MPKYQEKKLSSIKRQGKITQPVNVVIASIERNKDKYENFYLRVGLQQGNKVHFANAFGNEYSRAKDSLKVGQSLTLPRDTLSCEKYKNKLVFRFLHFPRTLNTSISNSEENSRECSSGLADIVKLKKAFSKKVENLRLVTAKVYRYWGCAQCTKSIPKAAADGKYYCKGNCKPVNSRTGKATERKICMLLQEIVLEDLCGHRIENVVAFDSECVRLLGKKGEEFNFDEEVQDNLNQILNLKLAAMLSRNNKKSGKFLPSIFIKNISIGKKAVYNESSNLEIDGYVVDTVDTVESMPEQELQLPKLDVKLETGTDKENKYCVDILSPYAIRSNPKGLVLLININFYRSLPQRYGSEEDVRILTEIFSLLSYRVYTFEDVKDRQEAKQIIEEFKEQLVAQEVDSSIVIIMGHGANNEIYMMRDSCNNEKDDKNTKDTATVNVIKDILFSFSPSTFKEFDGKPKVFIVNACQVFENREYTRNTKPQKELLLSDVFGFQASTPGYVSSRSEESGSLFIYSLVETLMNHYDLEIHEIFYEVQKRMKEYITKLGGFVISNRKKYPLSLPMAYTFLGRKFYFTGKNYSTTDDEEMDTSV